MVRARSPGESSKMAERAQIDTTDRSVDLSTLLFPLTDQMLIMPSVSVVEIMRLRPLRKVAGAPIWLYGSIVWRHIDIPVLSFEALNGDPAPDAGTGSRIVLIHAVGSTEDIPYVGMITQGVPHLMLVTPEDIKSVTHIDFGPAVAQRILVHGQRIAIPNLDYLQEQLRAFGQFNEQQLIDEDD